MQSSADGGRKVLLGNAAERSRVEEKAVDGEIATLYVFSGAGGVTDPIGVAAVGVGAVGTEGCDLGDGKAGRGDGGVFPGRRLIDGLVSYENDAEVRAHRKGAGKEFQNDVGRGG